VPLRLILFAASGYMGETFRTILRTPSLEDWFWADRAGITRAEMRTTSATTYRIRMKAIPETEELGLSNYR
jgi:hypothetical protein